MCMNQINNNYNHYYEKFTEGINLNCGYDFDYIMKYI